MYHKNLLVRNTLASAITLLAASAAMGDSAEEAAKLEEVIVTAQKRAEKLQEVPISVATVSGDKLDEAGIENIQDLTVLIPNIHLTETGISTQLRVRGIGSDNSQGFEQSVGMYVDGIHYGRAQLFRAPLMDMERAEVLRGPQGTLFGKNSIAGALNMTTARPTDEFIGKLTVSQEKAFNQLEVNGVVSGPLREDLRARLAVRTLEEDGYYYNTYTQEDEGIREESAYRLSLVWDASDNLELFFKAEQDEFDVFGRPFEVTYDVPLTEGGATYAQTLAGLGEPLMDTELDYLRQGDTRDNSLNKINNYTLSGNYEHDGYTLTFTTGILKLEYSELCECDFIASEILPANLAENYEQFSQEIRITSPLGEKLEWLAGIFYQDYDQTFEDGITITPTNLLVSAATPLLADTGLRRDFTQSSENFALFGRATWHVTDELHVTFGARYTEETKNASKVLNLFQPSTGDILDDPALGLLYLNLFRAETEQVTVWPTGDPAAPFAPVAYGGHNVSGERDESAFIPLLNVEYNFSEDVMGYASITKGFKAGGFDPRSNSVGNIASDPSTAPADEPNPSLFFEFEDEEATAFELGMKSTVADGKGEVNVALYYTDYDELQISQYDGAVGFNVGNAKDTIVQGVEVDGRWLLHKDITLHYGLSYLDFEYKDFVNGNCYAGQTRDGVDLNGDSIIDTCDYTGKRGVYTPEFTANLSLDYFKQINDYIAFRGFLDLQNVGSQMVHVNLDPKGMMEAYTMVNMRAGVEAEHWSLALLGKNLLREDIVSYSGNAPLSESNFNTNTHYSILRRPKTIALEASMKF